MLLRPRKFNYKNIFKRRSLRKSKTFATNKLSYGSIGLITLQPLRLNSKQIYRIKLLLKKGSRRSDTSKRRVWFNIFPHLPLSRKVTGSRMGKGTGKLSGWVIELYANTILFEYRNLRSGRAVHFCNQISYRLPVLTRLVRNLGTGKLRNISNSFNINLNSYW